MGAILLGCREENAAPDQAGNTIPGVHSSIPQNGRVLLPRPNPQEAQMNWIVTLIIGGVIGWLASMIMKTDAQMGIIANVIVGIVGSSVGFWLAGVLGIGAGSTMGAYLIAILGAVVLIGLLKALGVFK
jgi:uncharacterized membrane protein YeaQ/YmgE (transglycosylase-associated protein family)